MSDTEITFTGTYTCTHHNDAERTACPVCLVTALRAAETVALARWNGALERAMKAEADLAAERARLDWVFRNCKVEANDYTTGNRDVYAIHDREDLGAAMKEDAK
jgi:hypothetical protein